MKNMKKILSCKKTAIVLLIIAVLFLGFYTYMIARPISYGMSYQNETVYEGVEFEGTLRFYPDGKLLNKNTNFEEAFENYYYYKDGYATTYTCAGAIIFAIAGGVVGLVLIALIVSSFVLARKSKCEECV